MRSLLVVLTDLIVTERRCLRFYAEVFLFATISDVQEG